MSPPSILAVCLLTLSACSVNQLRSSSTPPASNRSREIIDTQLSVDVTALTGRARITIGPSHTPGASLEVGDLSIDSVRVRNDDLPFAVTGAVLILGLPASAQAITVDIAYRWRRHDWTASMGFSGAATHGYTNTWPYYCGNLFPCHSDPGDGTTFGLALRGVPPDKIAIFPAVIPAPAPAYQLAWSFDTYAELLLGTTQAGTTVSAWYRPEELERMRAGTAYLVQAFDWFEHTLGAYRFGTHVGSVSVDWPAETYGGVEHHPYWHVAGAALDNPLVHVHEAAHGWFGDGIRLSCWEDFVLSEGTASYLAARAFDVIAPTFGAHVWHTYVEQLASLDANLPVWPASCGQIDVLRDNLFTAAPYVRGAFFYRAVADRVGADQLDRALAQFYRQHAGTAARMSDMLTTIRAATGYDPTACAQRWLRDPLPPSPVGEGWPAPGPCP